MPTPPAAALSTSQFAADVRAGLSGPGQKTLPSKYLYDELGSALFEAISLLPEYGLTRADERLLREHASAIVDGLSKPVLVAEMGSGTGRKTRWILEALEPDVPTPYYPIEISQGALARCQAELGDLDSVIVTPLDREYLDGLSEVAERRLPDQAMLVLFLGSSIGNFAQPEAASFLSSVRKTLRRGDALLLGTDLQKSPEKLIPAYDDPTGVTAAFNLNMLGRMNRELNGNFNLRHFEHQVRFNPAPECVEMHLRSVCRQVVTVEKADLSVAFSEGETILTERSHKYSAHKVCGLAGNAGFRCARQWIDDEWPFAESLLLAE